VAVSELDPDTAETLAGVLRLLRRAAELAWANADAVGPRAPGQLLALGIDLAADDALNLLPGPTRITGPVPVGTAPAGLLGSAEQLLRRLSAAGAPAAMHQLRARVADLVWEANTGAGA